MKQTGKYSRAESEEFDLEAEIDLFVRKANELVTEVDEITYNREQYKKILKAVATTIIDNI